MGFSASTLFSFSSTSDVLPMFCTHVAGEMRRHLTLHTAKDAADRQASRKPHVISDTCADGQRGCRSLSQHEHNDRTAQQTVQLMQQTAGSDIL